MNLPDEINSVDKLNPRFQKAFEMEGNWYSLNSDVYDYFLPQRNIFDTEVAGQNKMDKIFDSTSLEAIQSGASKIQANIAPPNKRWAKVEPSEQVIRFLEENQDAGVTIDEVRENLDKQAEIAFDYINRSNFGTQFFEMCLDLLVGTGTMRIDEEGSLDMPFSFHSVAPKGIAYEEGPNGDIETHWRKFKVRARNVERTWPGFRVSQELAVTIKDSPDSVVEVNDGVVFSEGKYYGVAWVKGEEKISWNADYEDSSAFITGRWSKTAGEVRGRGPAMQTYPDVRSLNKAKEFMLQKAAIDLAGMYTAVDDGVTNPYNITISPGVVIPVGSNNSSNPSIQRLDTRTDLNLSQFVMVDLQTSIKRAFFTDLREPSDSVISATQYAIETRELAKSIGSAFGRLNTEVLTKVLTRVFYILQKKGLVNIAINGVETTVKFTSPLAAAQDQEDLVAIQQAVEFTMMTAGPELLKASYKLEEFGAYSAKLTGMPQELVRSKVERDKAIKTGANIAQQQLEQGQAPEVPQ